MDQETVKLNSVFKNVEIESSHLENLVKKTLSIINGFIEIYKIGFGSIHESRIFDNEGVVTRDGEIFFDPKKLKCLEEDVAMAIIAHELAHYHLGHYKKMDNALRNEEEADELAKKWGFNTDKYRKILKENLVPFQFTPNHEEQVILQTGKSRLPK